MKLNISIYFPTWIKFQAIVRGFIWSSVCLRKYDCRPMCLSICSLTKTSVYIGLERWGKQLKDRLNAKKYLVTALQISQSCIISSSAHSVTLPLFPAFLLPSFCSLLFTILLSVSLQRFPCIWSLRFRLVITCSPSDTLNRRFFFLFPGSTLIAKYYMILPFGYIVEENYSKTGPLLFPFETAVFWSSPHQ